MRNITAEQSNKEGPAPDSAGRSSLQQELLDEMTAWSPRDHGAFKTWHRHSLSLVHLNVLITLEARGPLPMSRLAEAMDVSDASATGIVDRMEKRGLVERRHSTGDRRQVLVHATDAGERVFRDIGADRRAALSAVLAELSEDELAALLTGTRAIRAARQRVLARAPADGTTGGAEPATE